MLDDIKCTTSPMTNTIYIGRTDKSGSIYLDKVDKTSEVIEAVRDYMLARVVAGVGDTFCYDWIRADGSEVELRLTAKNLPIHPNLKASYNSAASRYAFVNGHKIGETVYILDYDCDGVPYDYTGKILIAGTDRYAVLCPVINREYNPIMLCEHLYKSCKADNTSSDAIVVPWNECYYSEKEAMKALERIGGE